MGEKRGNIFFPLPDKKLPQNVTYDERISCIFNYGSVGKKGTNLGSVSELTPLSSIITLPRCEFIGPWMLHLVFIIYNRFTFRSNTLTSCRDKKKVGREKTERKETLLLFNGS